MKNPKLDESRHIFVSNSPREKLVLVSMLEFRSVTFNYPSGPSFDFPDFQCAEGEHLLLLGESGTGKTTLLHVLAGLLTPTGGEVILDGTDLVQIDSSSRDSYRGENIGIVFQTAHFIRSLSVIDNLTLPHFLTGRPIDKSKALAILNRLNLKHKANSFPTALSVGEQQRVAIARALVNDPKLILADEPTSALDDNNANEVINLLRTQAELSKASLIIVTHDQRLKDQFPKRVAL